MKKQNLWRRLLSGALAAAMLLLCLPLSLLTVLAAEAPDAPSELESLAGYLGKSETVKDKYGNPVYLHYYYDTAKEYPLAKIGQGGSVVVMYVMNTDTERIAGTEGKDAEIVSGMLERGYYVVVCDYCDNDVVSPDLDWSLQGIRDSLRYGRIKMPGRTDKDTSEVAGYQLNYIVPAGYDLAYNVPYFSFDEHGVAGTLERIVEVWNNDFKSVKRDTVVKWVNEDGTPKLQKTEAITVKCEDDKSTTVYDMWFTDAKGSNPISQAALLEKSADEQKKWTYTYIGNTKAETVTDCVKPDGSFIQLDLCMDIIYPYGAESASLPTMICMSSSETRIATWTNDTRPQLTGFLFSGYIGVIADYGYVPMSRTDHYGYFSGTDCQNSVSGDNYTYSLASFNFVLSDTAFIRTLRKLGKDGAVVTRDAHTAYAAEATLKLGLKQDGIGIYGNSKGGIVDHLAAPNPELAVPNRMFEGHFGETRYQLMQGTADLYDGYSYTDPYLNSDGTSTSALLRVPQDTVYPTFADGTTIPSGVNLAYGNCGGEWEKITADSAPIYGSGTQLSGGSYDGFYKYVMNSARSLDVPFFGLVSPDVGHSFGYGTDRDYGVDAYYAFHQYAHYWLRGDAPSLEIIDVDTTNDIGIAADEAIDYVYEIGKNKEIKFAFIGSIDRSKLSEIEIVDAVTGEALSGSWALYYGGQQAHFTPYDIKENTYYRITVPTTLTDTKGTPLAEEKSFLFRTAVGTSTAPTETAGSTTVTTESGAYFTFEKKDYTGSYKTSLRFTVTNDAVNNIAVAAADLADGVNATDAGVAWTTLSGEIVLTGDGIYTFDVTEWVKGCTGRPAFRLLATRKIGEGVDKTLSATSAGIVGDLSLSEISAPTEGAEKTLGILGTVRRSQSVDLNRDLNGTWVSSMELAAKFNLLDAMSDDTDYNRTFTVSFKIYDTTSRHILIYLNRPNADAKDPDKITQEYLNPVQALRTKANDWTEITLTFSREELYACGDRKQLQIYAESKSVLTLDEHVTVAASDFCNGEGKKSKTCYAGERGLNSAYTKYNTANEAKEAGMLTVDRSVPFWIGDVTVTEARTGVTIGAAALEELPQTTDSLSPIASATVDSAQPDTALGNTTLTVGGGTRPTDTASRKLYFKLSLSDYKTNYPAYFSFIAEGKNTTISLYGLADAAQSDSWTEETVTASNAPANDPTTGGLKLSETYGGAPLATYKISGKQTVTADISAYATAMLAQGAKTLTLILVGEDTGATAIYIHDFENWTQSEVNDGNKAGMNTGGFDGSQKVYGITEETGNQSLTIRPYAGWHRFRFTGLFGENTNVNNASNKAYGTNNHAWTDDEIGDVWRVTFRAKSSVAGGYIKYGLMSYCARNGEAVDYSTNFYGTTENKAYFTKADTWYTFTLEFTVDEGMKTLAAKYGDSAISYFAIVTDGLVNYKNYNAKDPENGIDLTGGGTDLLDSRPTLQIDDITSTKLPAVTTIEPIVSSGALQTGYYDFKNDLNEKGETKWTTYYARNHISTGGFSTGSDPATMTVNKETGNLVFAPYANCNRLRFNALFGELDGNTTQGEWESRKNHLWTEADIGKTYRISFRAKATAAGTLLSYGLTRGNQTNYTELTDAAVEAQANGTTVNYVKLKDGQTAETVEYHGAAIYGTRYFATFEKAGEWQTFTMEFTVDAQMLPMEVVSVTKDANGNVTTVSRQYAMSFLEISTDQINGIYSGKYDQSHYTVEGGALAGVYTDTGYVVGKTDKDPMIEISTIAANEVIAPTGSYDFSTEAIFAAGGFGGNDEVVSYTTEEDGNRTFTIKPYAGWHRFRFAGLFGELTNVYNNNKSHTNSNHAWTEEEIGDVWRVTFRAKSSVAGEILSYGLMRVAKATTGTNTDYSQVFYEPTERTANFEKADTWYTFTLEFTVDENMLTVDCSDGSIRSAMSYFSFTTNKNYPYAAEGLVDDKGDPVAGTEDLRPVIQIDDIVSVKIGRKNADGSVTETPLTDRTSLGCQAAVNVNGAAQKEDLTVYAEPTAERTDVKNLFLSFKVTDTTDLYAAKLSFLLRNAVGQKLFLYCLGDTEISASLTWGNAPRWSAAPIATLVATGDSLTVDVTEYARKYAGKTLTFVLVAEELAADLTVETPLLTIDSATPSDTFDASSFKVKSNLTLASDLCYNLYVPKLDTVKGITLDGEMQKLSALPTRVESGVTYYVLTKALAAKDAADSVALEVTVDTGVKKMTATYAFSIPAYAKKVVNGSFNDETKTLLRDMLAYIDAAMTYFGTATDEKRAAITDVTGEDYALPDDADVGLAEEDIVFEKNGDAVESAALFLKDAPAFAFKLAEGKEDLADSFNFTMNGTPLKVEKLRKDGRTYLVVTTYAYGMNDTLTFTYTGGSGSYNLAKYHSGTDASNTDLKALTVRLAQYANSAKAYKKAASENAQ